MKKSDFLLLLSLLVLSALLFAVFALIFSGTGKEVVVRVDGKEYARLPLEKDTELLIDSEYGTNLLVIKDGEARITEASCPTHRCICTGKASELKTIVCEPNRVTVTVE